MVHGVYHSKALSTSGCWKTSKDKYSNREPITMFLTELAEPTLLVIYPGRFQPFHKGHYAVYEYLTGKFGRNNVYIATSNKTDNAKSPFTFAEKAYFMQLTGVPADRIVQATQPYQIQNVFQFNFSSRNQLSKLIKSIFYNFKTQLLKLI